ncbi:Ger(x)C family spore germination protein [Brevibacillus daliensis]|uniref:Ger(x)C family spore germination protein n=1 Tax=Brevibacillus daliensis TaxID=2892995 RepID=UPI001E4C2803|nr:Ger(x)C family spore germination protein [Brevibacillus daliensis]
MTNKSFIIILLFLLATLTSGCRDQRIMEKLGFTHTVAYDLLPNGKTAFTLTLPKADKNSEAHQETLTAVSDSYKDATIIMGRQTHFNLVNGQMRNVLFGTALAKQGLWNHLNALNRDPVVSPLAKITIASGNAGDILKKDYKEHPKPGKYIDLLLDKQAKNFASYRITLFSFSRDYYDDGIDPIAPTIKDNGDTLETFGLALFQDDKYVTKLPPKDTILFAFLTGTFRKGNWNMYLSEKLKKKELVVLNYLNSTKKVQVTHDQTGTPHILYDLTLKGTVVDYTGPLNLSIDAERHELEKKIGDHVRAEAKRMVAHMQKYKADSLGIGKHVRNSMSYSQWKKMNWREEYPKVVFDCKIKVTIMEYGTFR